MLHMLLTEILIRIAAWRYGIDPAPPSLSISVSRYRLSLQTLAIVRMKRILNRYTGARRIGKFLLPHLLHR
jgi:hypothetical protein